MEIMKRISIGFTADEWERIDRESTAAGITRPAYLRMRIFASAPVFIDAAEIGKCTDAVRELGERTGDVSRALNAQGAEAEQIRSLCTAYWEVVAFMKDMKESFRSGQRREG